SCRGSRTGVAAANAASVSASIRQQARPPRASGGRAFPSRNPCDVASQRARAHSLRVPDRGAKILAAAGPVTEVGVFNGRRFFAGTVAGKSVVMGLTGIGLVDADLTTRAVPAFLQSSGDRVNAVVFSGVAGSSYNIADV